MSFKNVMKESLQNFYKIVGKGNWGRGLKYHGYFCLLLFKQEFSALLFWKPQCEWFTQAKQQPELVRFLFSVLD